MKKLSLISMGLVLLMAMTQCKKQETPTTNENEGEKVHITLDVDNGSKNFVHPETGTAFFTDGDEVLVANNNHYVGTLTYDGNNRHFSGDITGAVESDYLHFYFMGNQDLLEGTPSSSTTSFTVNISDQTNCYPQIAYNHSTAFYSESVTSYKAQLLNQCALVKFTTNEIPVETVVTVSGLNNQVSVDLGEPATFTSSKVDGGNIALHAESATSRWAILLPQTDFTGVTANALGFDEASVSFGEVSSINENDYLTEGVSFTMTAPALTFKARTAGVSVGVDDASGINLQYSRDGVNWETYTSAITLENVNDIVSFRGNNVTFNYRRFTCSNGQCYIYGNVMSLLHATDYATNYELSDEAFYYVFAYNQNIDIDPEKDLLLPALELAPYCYHNMFNNCTGLTKAPTLPATKLANYCYSNMFSNCTGLTTAPALPATKLAPYCYYNMFQGCTGLTTAPALPATQLASDCYSNMFYNCTGLTAAPALPATTLAQSCYYYMFCYCTGLTTAPELPATTLAPSCYSSMFYNCTSLTTAPDELPATTLAQSCYNYMFYNCTGLTTAPMLPATTLANYCYSSMFYNCSGLTTAPELPATTLAQSCYNYMFCNCTGLTTAPMLPATTLANSCYSSMFNGCTGLTTAPVLPATTLAQSCYNYMFQGCTGLTTAPALPATTLANYCYNYMFQGCTGLTTAPALPATTLAPSCYAYMFYGCSNLSNITCLATSGINQSSSTYYWVNGVASTGTFTKASGVTSWPTGNNGIPSNWTVNEQ